MDALPDGCLPLAQACMEPMARPRFDEIYDAHFDFVWRMLRRLGISEANLDDAAQDVFVTIHRRLDEFEGRSAMRSWVFGVTSHVARDHRRRHRRKEAPCVAAPVDSESDIAIASAAPSPVALAERQQRVELLNRLLDRLDDDKREILILSFLEQLTVPEIAELLGLNVNTTYSRLRVAKVAFDVAYASEKARDRQEAP